MATSRLRSRMTSRRDRFGEFLTPWNRAENSPLTWCWDVSRDIIRDLPDLQ